MLHLLPFLFHAALALGAALAVVTVVTLTVHFLVDWFVARAALLRADKNKLAMTVADMVKNGKVSYIQGIFDTTSGKFTQARRIFADRVDDDVKQAHKDNPAAVWNI